MSMKTKLSVYVNMNHSNIVERSSMKLREICSKFCSMAARIRAAGEYTKKYYFLMVEMKNLEKKSSYLGFG